ncbi:hypothetical protein V6N12_027095 [Hibiscus sabdariffa]|uniref:Uncharacterized protein n=1 Tax=Hibiscus sabdariffa TaxID=183260 RepID=A0ABR2DUU1_9ROSI
MFGAETSHGLGYSKSSSDLGVTGTGLFSGFFHLLPIWNRDQLPPMETPGIVDSSCRQKAREAVYGCRGGGLTIIRRLKGLRDLKEGAGSVRSGAGSRISEASG